MYGMLEYGLITDDPLFASVMSSYFQGEGYFPIFSLPRMARNDWEIEVWKRAVAIRRSGAKLVFCQMKDYGLLAPLRNESGMDFFALENPSEALSIAEIDIPKQALELNEKDYFLGLLSARNQHKIIKIINGSHNIDFTSINQRKSDTLVIIEKANLITDVCALNYAYAKGHQVHVVNPVSESLVDQLKELFISLSAHDARKKKLFKKIYNEIRIAISSVVDWEQIQRDYSKVQFVVRHIPLGILIESIPVAHIHHLQSELRFIDEFFYLELTSQLPKAFVPSMLFVDVGAKDLISEVPEISDRLKEKRCWQFNLCGKNANRENFGLYTRYFPYDLMLISGHGKSPDCREVIYSFEDLKGKRHEVKLLEYYQLGPVKGEKVLVETKEYFLEFDGIAWDDKERLAQIGISHLVRQWINAHHQGKTTLVKYKEVNPRSILGIGLHDGVYIGFTHIFSQANNPILLLNTCASLIELGDMLCAAGPRSLVGTMWSIYDKDARRFANSFFDAIQDVSICEAFHTARQRLENRYSKMAYVYFGTLDSYLPMPSASGDEKEAAQFMAGRLTNSLSEAIVFASKGWISPDQVDHLRNLEKLTERFLASDLPQEVDLRQKINKLRTRIDLTTMGSGDTGLSSPLGQ
ncbi:MAG: hypothetical protein ACYS1A_01625 [Planctomycetota bacterium]|jgi:hypothetical protein